MLKVSRQQINPPNLSEELEDISMDLIKESFGYSSTQQNGRRGTRQNGVDVFSGPTEKGCYLGVQCKAKDLLTKQNLTISEMQQEVEKAKTFQPPLEKYIIITTIPRSPLLQEEARKITLDNIKEGSFVVEVWSWDDFKQYLEDCPKTLQKHYSGLTPGVETMESNLRDEIKRLGNQILKNQGVGNSQEVKKGVQNFTSESIYNRTEEDIKPYNEKNKKNSLKFEIDEVRKLLDTKPSDAIKLLLSLKKNKWKSASDYEKFRIITNLAAGYARINQPKKASNLFVEALKIKENEKSLCNAARAYLFFDNLEKTRELIKQVLDKKPNSIQGNVLNLYINKKLETEELIKLIPNKLLKNHSINFALADILKDKDIGASLNWIKLANKHLKKYDPDYEALRGEILLKSIIESKDFAPKEFLKETSKKTLEEARGCYKNAWNFVRKNELYLYKSFWLANSCVINRSLGSYEIALQNLEEAIEIEPKNTEYIKQRAILLFELNRFDDSIKDLNKLLKHDKDGENHLILADVFVKKKDKIKAINILRKALVKYKNNLFIKKYLIQLLVQNNKVSDARKFAEIINIEQDRYIELAKIEISEGNKDGAIELLKKAKNIFVSPSENIKLISKIELADLFYDLDQFGDALDLYEGSIEIKEDNNYTRKILNSYYRIGRLGDALSALDKIGNVVYESRYLSELKSSIYEQINDLGNSAQVCIDYLNLHKDDDEMLIRLGVTYLRTSNFKELDKIIKRGINLKNVSFEYGAQFSNLCIQRDKILEAVNTMYEMRRTNFNKSDAHLYYIGLFLLHDDRKRAFLDSKQAKVNSAVLLNTPTGQRWYILDERTDADLTRNEINNEHPFFKELLNKKPGDKFLIKENLIDEEFSVDKVESKYIYALHESMNNFNEWFPKDHGLQRIKVDVNGKDIKEEPGFKLLFDQAEKRRDFVLNAEKYYKNGMLTVGAFAKLIGTNVIDVWSGMIEKNDLGIKCSSGVPQEREEAIKLFLNQKIKFVVDIISLLTIFEINLQNKIVKKFGKLIVAQSTIDVLNQIIHEKKQWITKGYSSLSKTDDGFINYEITKQQIKKNVSYLNEIVDWLKENAVITPCNKKLSLDNDERLQRLDDMLGHSFLETILIASEDNNVLFSDDERLRSLAKHEFNTNGVWTQLILMFLKQISFISLDEYSEYTLKLITKNYFHTSISREVLIHALKKSEWKIEEPFKKALNVLRADNSDVISATRVSAEFLYDLWKINDIFSLKKDDITIFVLSILTGGRNVIDTLDKLKHAVARNFVLSPIDMTMVISIIDNWFKTSIK